MICLLKDFRLSILLSRDLWKFTHATGTRFAKLSEPEIREEPDHLATKTRRAFLTQENRLRYKCLGDFVADEKVSDFTDHQEFAINVKETGGQQTHATVEIEVG